MKKQLSILLLAAFLVGCASSKPDISSSNSSINSNIPSSLSESSSIEPSYYESFSFIPIKEDVAIHSELVSNYFKQEQYDYSKMDARINAKTDLGDNLPDRKSVV